jgi:hypothetical protein
MNADNKFGKCCGCPAMMSDKGRLFTNYLDNTRLNVIIKQKYGIYNNHDYRLMLQTYGNKFIMDERAYNNQTKRCDFNKLN